MQTLDSINKIINEISFNDWKFHVSKYGDGTPYVQILFMDKDRISGIEELQRCRKWILSFHMTNSEVVRTCHKAVQAAMLHEVDEAFKYKGARIFNPHVDLDDLASAIKDKIVKISLRDESTYPNKTSL